jgi:PilZ domain
MARSDPYAAILTGPEPKKRSYGLPSNKRRFVRAACRLEAKIAVAGNDFSLIGTVTDISPAGCYLEMFAPLPMHMRVDLMVESAGMEFRGSGMVRSSLAGMGMGVGFDPLTKEQLKRLKKIIPDLADIPLEDLLPDEAKPQAVPDPPAKKSAKSSAAGSAARAAVAQSSARPATSPAPESSSADSAPSHAHSANAAEVLEATIRILLKKKIITRAEITEELGKVRAKKH